MYPWTSSIYDLFGNSASTPHRLVVPRKPTMSNWFEQRLIDYEAWLGPQVDPLSFDDLLGIQQLQWLGFCDNPITGSAIFNQLHPPASIAAYDIMDVDQQLPSSEPEGERILYDDVSLLGFL
ncbi:hypothetical protein MIR68_003823 [Amoeboaphelidium protococcarum]|nr:hypothetical protein MIR68_003823 [Amoeboaphelidium protococcarum]